MKKFLSLIILILALGSAQVNAQIYNPGFEQLNNDGSISNWGNVYLMAISIDTNGVSTMDSMVFDNQYYAPSTDAHSGSYAMELRNSYNYTQGYGIAGSVSNDTNEVYSAWGSLAFVPLQTTPTELNFYYKFFPVNGDTASATLIIYDAAGDAIGTASIIIGGLVSSYNYVSSPIDYSIISPAAFYSLNFSTTAYGFEPSLGTRLLIDDVSFSSTTGIDDHVNAGDFKVYPNPAIDILHIESNVSTEETDFKIFDVTGKILMEGKINSNEQTINTGKLNKGVYFLQLNSSNYSERKVVVIN